MGTNDHSDATGDPLVDDIRAIRRAIWQEDGNDLARHVERLKQVERQHRERVVLQSAQATGKRTCG